MGDRPVLCLSEALPGGVEIRPAIGDRQLAAAVEAPPKGLQFTVPADLAPGEHRVSVNVGQQPLPLTGSLVLRVFGIPGAEVESVSPAAGSKDTLVRVSGRGFNAPPEQISMRIGEKDVQVQRVAPDGTWFVAKLPEAQSGTWPVSVSVWGVPATLPQQGVSVILRRHVETWKAAGGALGVVAALVALVLGLYRAQGPRRGRTGEPRPGFWHALLVEPANNTYSLSRAQFFWWLLIAVFSFSLLVIGRGFHEGSWTYPQGANFAVTFLISIGTLLGVQAVSTFRGVKGSGVVHPAASDLIVHGGVLAPERVQQLVFTVLAGLVFIASVLTTYATAGTLPEVPNELLLLMGFSSFGYVGGKLVRQPGPVISKVESTDTVGGGVAGPGLIIRGQHLSRDARVFVDGSELTQGTLAVIEADGDERSEFAKAVGVALPGPGGATALTAWRRVRHQLILVNPDQQRAEWDLEVPTITGAELGADAQGQRQLTLTATNIRPGAVARVNQLPPFPLTRSESSAVQWVAQVVGSVASGAATVTVVNPDLGEADYPFTVPA